jgi:tRNA-specific 2-thiouridylase
LLCWSSLEVSKRVLLAMSGGVDSSVAAYLLREQGYDVVGLFMRTGAHDNEPATATTSCSLPVIDTGTASHTAPHKRGCCSAADAADARRVADMLDIPFYALDFQHDFGRIMDYFVEEYIHGRTPNPCVMCNNWLKFGRLWEYAQRIGADRIATGHYARTGSEGGGPRANGGAPDESDRGACCSVPSAFSCSGRPPSAVRRPPATRSLLRACDPNKDQSYVLFGLKRELLPHLLFPVGEYSKHEIRQIARTLGLRVADKRDSQEICFVPSQDYVDFIQRRQPGFDGSGEIVDTAGQSIGRHGGYEGYTIGQRKGLGVALGERRYVVRIDAVERRVVIGPREELLRRSLLADRVNWLIDPPTATLRCSAKIRYLHQAASATVAPTGDAQAEVAFDEPQSAITPGQAVVFYDCDRVLGGGFIR